MDDRAKRLGRGCPDTLRGGVFGDELRVDGLEVTELLHEGVKRLVGDLRSVENIIPAGVAADLIAQDLDPAGSVTGRPRLCHAALTGFGAHNTITSST